MSAAKPRRPRKSIIGDKFEAVGEKDSVFFERIYWVGGPGLDLVACASKEDAETIAAALNFASRADSLNWMAKDLAAELNAISEIFEGA